MKHCKGLAFCFNTTLLLASTLMHSQLLMASDSLGKYNGQEWVARKHQGDHKRLPRGPGHPSSMETID